MNTFQELGLSEELLQAIKDMGFETPSDVQTKTIPLLLEKETDVVSLAQTGTGKQQLLASQCCKRLMQKVKSRKD